MNKIRGMTLRVLDLTLISSLLMALAGCPLLSGCMSSARHLAAYENPKLAIDYDGRGFHLEAGSNFKGHAEGHYNVETHQADAVIDVDSDVASVDKAQGERADHLIELRRQEAQLLAAETEAMTGMVNNVTSVLGGVLGGSTVRVPMGPLGTATGTLGTPAAKPNETAKPN